MPHPTLSQAAARVEAELTKRGIQFTLGGEPTYVPTNPQGSEWSVTALGPTKLGYGYRLAEELTKQFLPTALTVYSPGKRYPGEANPRWSLNMVWRVDGAPLVRAGKGSAKPTLALAKQFCAELLTALKVKGKWIKGTDPLAAQHAVWILPLDHDGKQLVVPKWGVTQMELLGAEGPAGLRLPLQLLPPEAVRRALTVDFEKGELNVFLPPLLQAPWTKILQAVATAAKATGMPLPKLAGYVPSDEADVWEKLAIAADPGVLEINLPPCPTWEHYADWLKKLEAAGGPADLCSYKYWSTQEQMGTGGGNHLLFGGPSLATNPFFTHPRWLVSILRYWQRHPSLAYFFTGPYVGSASQAPRPDESVASLYDLEMAYQLLEKLPKGDHRHLIGETLRHLHTDTSGNTHRSETSFDKFWNAAFDGGCRGLMEFRAVETYPKAEWMSAVALLWRAMATMLLKKPWTQPLVEHGDRLHDAFFLPSTLWADLQEILADLKKAGFGLPEGLFREIFEWRFPTRLAYAEKGRELQVRKALEAWPLLCETPLEGGSTSRFVDTSIERLEFTANAKFAAERRVFVQGRELVMEPLAKGVTQMGLRYRRTALYPSLHPGILPHMPLRLVVTDLERKPVAVFELTETAKEFVAVEERAVKFAARACQRLKAGLRTCDLRLP